VGAPIRLIVGAMTGVLEHDSRAQAHRRGENAIGRGPPCHDLSEEPAFFLRRPFSPATVSRTVLGPQFGRSEIQAQVLGPGVDTSMRAGLRR
jgi:hypothetical protein